MSEPPEKVDVSSLKDTFLECPVCVEHFNQTDRRPRLLHSCLHAFCTQCLQQLLDKEGNGEITCPLCRRIEKVSGTAQMMAIDPVRDQLLGVSAHFLSTWVGMNSTDDVKIVQVQNGNPEFTRVHQTFTDALGTMPVHIRRIDRVQNKTLCQQYQAKKQLLEKQNPGTTVEKMLWHGTPQVATMSIMTYGFNRSYCDKDRNALGQGVYFTSDAAYASRDRYAPADGQGNRHMFLCKFLTGSYTQGDPQIRTPPQKDAAKQELYDSVVDDPANPKIFVVFSDTHAYPMYLISFQ